MPVLVSFGPWGQIHGSWVTALRQLPPELGNDRVIENDDKTESY
jgi:hypothetical protein